MDVVSGPDVGGGFLFHLTQSPAGARTTYVVHAQDGGLDGGDPPPAGPSALGFAPAEGMCPLGGRACWHRESVADPTALLRVRFAYNRLRFVARPLLEIAAGRRPVSYEAGLKETIHRVVPRAASSGIPWVIGGSAAPALLGASVAPNDLDLGTTRDGVDVIAAALEEYLIDAPAERSWGPGPPRRTARAFVGTFQDGLKVEWGERLRDDVGSTPELLEWTSVGSDHATLARFEQVEVPVVPPEFALVKAVALGRWETARAVARLVRARGLDGPLLTSILANARVSPAQEHLVRDLLTSTAPP